MGNEVGAPKGRARSFRSYRHRWIGPLVVLGGVATVATACSGASRETGTASPRRLVIGQVVPRLGLFAWMGRPEKWGVRLAVQDINSEGGVLGKPVVLHQVEDATVTQEAERGRALLERHVDAVIATTSGGTGSFDQLMASNGVVQCLPNRSTPFDAGIATGPTTFSTAPPDSAAAPAIVGELLTQRMRSVALAVPNNSQSSNLASAVTDGLAKNHVPVTTIPYDPNTADFPAVARHVLASKPKAVVVLAGAEGPALTRALIKAGAAPGSIIGGPDMFTPTLPRAIDQSTAAVLNGVYVAGPGGDAAFDARVGQTTANNLLDAAQSYDCAVIIALAARETKSADPGEFASQLAGVTRGKHECTTYPLCTALLQQWESIAYVGHAGPRRLNAQNEPTSAREILGYFNNGYLGQAGSHDSLLPGSSSRQRAVRDGAGRAGPGPGEPMEPAVSM